MQLSPRHSRMLHKQLDVVKEILDIDALRQIKEEVPKALVALNSNIESCLKDALFSADDRIVKFRHVIHIEGLRTVSPEAGRVISDFVYSYASSLINNDYLIIRLRQDQSSETGLAITFSIKSKLLDPASDAEVVTTV